jgi:hypothetical protein
MATFYVLPSRLQVGQRFGEFLHAMFAGAPYSSWDWPDLADSLASLVEAPGDVFLVYREDLDEAISVRDSLLQQFGAALDDDIIEIDFGTGLNRFLHQRWATEGKRQAA